MFHLPGLPSDLPHPEVLWARVGAYASVCAGLGLAECVPGPGAVHFQLVLGARFCLARVAGGTFLLIGEDPENTAARARTRPIDPFQGAPEALPWDRLAELPRPDFVYWWDGEWARAPYPDDWADDGLAATVGWCADLDDFTEWVVRAALDTTDPAGTVSARKAVADLAARARERTLGADALAAVLDHAARADADPAAGLALARELGLTGEQRPEEMEPGGSRPAAAPPAIGGHSLMLLLGDAMRTARELPGRGDGVTVLAADADPNGRAEEALAQAAALVRDHLLGDADRRVLVYRAPHPHGLVHDDLVPVATGPGLHTILERLRRDEGDADGRWLFARLTVTREDAVLERAYDHWPEWMPGPVDEEIRELGFAHSTGEPADVDEIRAEMARRTPSHRPSWADLLSERVADDPPWPGPPDRPSVPPLRIPLARRVALIDEIADRMRCLAQGLEWSRLRLTYRALAGYAGGTLTAVRPDGDRDLPVERDLRAALEVLRSATYIEDRGAWFTVDIAVGPSSGWRVVYDRDGEPDFSLPPRAFDHALDLRYFPRSSVNVPLWLAERLRVDAP
ncbi:hypothetical protein [Nocardiopsis sp. CC223A]|uniref:hypothetical protein n=1 Tax=Nocardiopsis sp. CC223A TaxID=3044051 RepID=UPI00278BD10D|nr:hypothetical protein [Nocardiopsis sp. CC223A]